MLASALLCVSAFGDDLPTWAKAILKSGVTATVPPQPDWSQVKGTTQVMVTPTMREVIFDGQARLEALAAIEANKAASTSLWQGSPQSAYDKISAFRKAHPAGWDFTADWALDSTLLVGHFEEALELARALIKRDGVSDVRLVELATAAAGVGRAEPGQYEYVRQQLALWSGESGTAKTMLDIEELHSPANTLWLGLFALGQRNQPFFLDGCQKIRPRDAATARETVSLYSAQKRYAQVRRICDEMVDQLPAGADRDFFSAESKSVAGKPDVLPSRL